MNTQYFGSGSENFQYKTSHRVDLIRHNHPLLNLEENIKCGDVAEIRHMVRAFSVSRFDTSILGSNSSKSETF